MVVLKAALITAVLVLLVVITIPILVKFKPQILAQLTKVIINQRFDGKSKFSLGKSFAEIKTTPQLICLAHLGSGPTECILGTDVPNRGDTQAIGNKLQEILIEFFDKTVLRYDGTNERELMEVQPRYILLSLTRDLFEFYRKYRMDPHIISRLGEEHLPILNLLESLEPKSSCKEHKEKKLSDSPSCLMDTPQYTLVTLTFGSPAPNGFPDYDGRMNQYKMPEGMNNLMCLIDGIPIHESSHPKMDAFKNSAAYKELQNMIYRCKEAEDAEEQRVNMFHKLSRRGMHLDPRTSKVYPCIPSNIRSQMLSKQTSIVDSSYSLEEIPTESVSDADTNTCSIQFSNLPSSFGDFDMPDVSEEQVALIQRQLENQDTTGVAEGEALLSNGGAPYLGPFSQQSSGIGSEPTTESLSAYDYGSSIQFSDLDSSFGEVILENSDEQQMNQLKSHLAQLAINQETLSPQRFQTPTSQNPHHHLTSDIGNGDAVC